MVKTRFLLGLARRITETIGTINFPSVKETLGALSSQAASVEAFVYGMEAKGTSYGPYFVPDRGLLYASQVHGQALYPQMVTAIRELVGGGMLVLPSSVEDFAVPEIEALIGRTQYSPACSSTERVKLMKLAWDSLGSEFASRHGQYEMFYSGPRSTTTSMAYRNRDWDQATDMVGRMMDRYASPQASAGPAS
jgi:4-hydroxyphenylacetate 3-monooxygenase